MEKCSFAGCVNNAHSLGLCNAHYAQQRKGKELKKLQLQFHGLSELDRFEKWYSKQPNGCWAWLGSVLKNKKTSQKEWHGQWRNSSGEHELSNRAAWRLYVGVIPTGAFVLHRCDNPKCVNPEHLFLGSQTDNMNDMWDKGRSRPGVSHGSNHGMSKLTESQVKEIRESKEAGTAIAKRFGMSTTTIYDIRNRKIWKHLK